jgi:hypothetical protein
MRIISLFFLLLLIVPAQAQDCCPRTEFSVGYAYFNADPKGDRINSNSFDSRYGQTGIAFSGVFNHSRRLGLVGDFSYHWRESTIDNVKIDTKTLIFLFGPRYTSRSQGFTSFAQALIGGTRRKNETATGEVSGTDFTIGIGFGGNIEVNKSFGIRLFQLDYLPSRGETVSGQKQWNHNFRIQAGITFKLGQIE